MKPPLRTKSVGTKVSEAEFVLLKERARGARVASGRVGSGGVAVGADGRGRGLRRGCVGGGSGLRSLLNLHFCLATIPAAEMRGLIERAGGSKLGRERLAAARASRATGPDRRRRQDQNLGRSSYGGVGAAGILEEVAELDAGVDAAGGVGVAGVLRQDAEAVVEWSWIAAERLYLTDYLAAGGALSYFGGRN